MQIGFYDYNTIRHNMLIVEGRVSLQLNIQQHSHHKQSRKLTELSISSWQLLYESDAYVRPLYLQILVLLDYNYKCIN